MCLFFDGIRTDDDMKTDTPKKRSQLTLRSMFMHMMENGYEPEFEDSHIQFGIGEDTAVIEHREGILSVRLFYSIDEEEYELFLEASNMTMLRTYSVKVVVLEDMTDLMFSWESACENIRDFKRILPIAVTRLKEAIRIHKEEMKKLIFASGVAAATIPAADISMAGIGKRKIVS